jgi:integrase/recombinase XerD
MSPHTVCSYRDSIRLLLRFLAERHDRDVVKLDFDDLAPNAIIAFLAHLEETRHNAAATRNARLAAIHAFARFAATNHPEHLELCQRVLAVPFKRARPRLVEYLEAHEIAAILDAPDCTSRDGRRDHALMLTLFNTGARVQEILDVRPSDLQLVRPFQVRLRGKGRKERICPLWPKTVKILRAFLAESGIEPTSTQQLFRNHRGEPLTRFGVRYLLRKYTNDATSVVSTLAAKRIHPHAI